MRAFAAAWPEHEFVQTLSGQITWSHHKVLLDKLDDPEIRLWYAESAAAQCWSVRMLEHQIATHLHLRQGSATTNFAATLPAPDSELAQEMLRDPYDLSFLPGAQIAKERDLEEALLADIVKFMLNAVDDQIRRPHHNETVGILLCTGRNRQVVEYALRGVEAPIGVSTYTVDRTALTKELPPNLKQQLPSVGELTTGLQRIVDERAGELAVALEEDESRASADR